MGQKVHPTAFRIGYNQTWRSRWYADKNYKKYLIEDLKLREYLEKKLSPAGLDRVDIERSSNMVYFKITVARPGVVIGKGGATIDELNRVLSQKTGSKVKIDIVEVDHPDLSAKVVADSITSQLAKRVNYRRAMKQAVSKSMQAGAKGVKVMVSGRLNGADIARREWVREGAIPLHTIRSFIDYATSTSFTTYGTLGVKVWIYKGEKQTYIENYEGKA